MRTVFFFTLLVFVTVMTSAQTPGVHYRLGMSRPWTHLFEVEVTYDRLPASRAALELILPVWRTGRYVILDFAGSIQEFEARDGNGKPLSWEKTDKTTWRIETGGQSRVTAKYKVFANEFALRTKGLNDEGAFLDGVTAFMYAREYRHLPVTLTVVPYKQWRVTTGLERAGRDPNIFTAPDYDYLADCPLLIGTQEDFSFDAEGKKHVLSIMGDGNYDAERIIEDLKVLITLHKDFWGRLPYEQYVFMLYLNPQGGGGTEHINSTIMGVRPFIFNNPTAYQNFLALVAHEFFHTWNIKQIRPRGLNPYDWTRENYLKELWVAEGTTDYYDRLFLVRAGFQSASSYLEQLPGRIEAERRRPGNRIQSVVESSFDAWVKYWKGNQNSYNAESDYYDRGLDLSLALDLEIRHRSGNTHSLDDVMRALFERFPLSGPGYTVDDLRALCEEYAGSSLKTFFDEHVFGTRLLEWERVLSYAGLEVTATPREHAWLGLSARDDGGRTVVRFVIAGSPAFEAGVNIDDDLIAVNGYRIRANDLASRIADMNVGDRVTLTIIRNDRLREFTATLGTDPVARYSVRKMKNPSDLQKAIFSSWLSTPWEPEESQSN